MRIAVSKCAFCGEHLLDKSGERQSRSDRRFCGSSCRGRYRRWKINLDRRANKAIKFIKEMAEYLDHPEAQEHASKRMAEIIGTVNREAAAHGIRQVM